ncbi:terminase large subunit domain-containing protein [Lysobacter niastensis]|uniref:Terminase n=1 Tax=Lysobacter niastensis TaxID=380629 RepID=A0ABS0B308_9GAMM|nr:terminase family protein [Lysobacter niastensis]MBF6022865.1 hypothetical protein [Lysobacter niastensis]
MSWGNEKLRRALAWKLDPAQMMRDAGFEPDPHQMDLLTCDEQNTLVLWPRQSGKSQTCAVCVLHQASFDPGDVIILAGEKQKQAQEVFNKAFDLHAQLSELGELPKVEKSGEELRFSNGSRVLALPSTVESIRGYAAKLALVDEAAFTEDGTLAKISPMLTTTNGRLICSSTPNGATGWFHESWHHGGEGWHRLTVTVEQLLAYPNARLTAAEIERQRLILTPLQFRQEFGLEWLDGDLQFFPTETIESALCDEIVPLFERLAVAA